MRSIVRNCYRHHGREDLLHVFGDDGSLTVEQQSGTYTGTMVQTINNPDGTVSIIQIDTGPNSVVTLPDGTQATVVHSMTAVSGFTVKILKFGTPQTIAIIVLKLVKFDVTLH